MHPTNATTTQANRQDAARQQPDGGLRFDWTMIALSAWLLGGAYVDG